MMRPLQVLSQALLALTVLSAPAFAQAPQSDEEHYRACMAQTRTRPSDAFDDATAWEGLGGGYPARHCALAALIELGHYNEAAQGLEKLADLVHADAGFKARLLVQAAQAWTAADTPERARAVADAALALAPKSLDVLRARARALAALGAYWEAADDLGRVIADEPNDVESLVLRGAAYRQLEAFDLALDDLNRALDLEPANPEGLLERGNTYRLQGDKAKARADWRALIEAAPDSEAARAAGDNLHRLDSGLEPELRPGAERGGL